MHTNYVFFYMLLKDRSHVLLDIEFNLTPITIFLLF